MMNLSGKVSLVTGAGSGIGKEIALQFAKEGATVVVADINRESAEQTSKEIERLAGHSIWIVVDVRSAEQIQVDNGKQPNANVQVIHT
jgi:3-hydroxybutyrate dehydrogenase